MQLVFHRIKFTTNIADSKTLQRITTLNWRNRNVSSQTTYKDDWQLCDTKDEARQQILTLQNIHGDALDSWGIAAITDASEKSWAEK